MLICARHNVLTQRSLISMGTPVFLFQNWSSYMLNIQWKKFEQKSVATFVSEELPKQNRFFCFTFVMCRENIPFPVGWNSLTAFFVSKMFNDPITVVIDVLHVLTLYQSECQGDIGALLCHCIGRGPTIKVNWVLFN